MAESALRRLSRMIVELERTPEVAAREANYARESGILAGKILALAPTMKHDLEVISEYLTASEGQAQQSIKTAPQIPLACSSEASQLGDGANE